MSSFSVFKDILEPKLLQEIESISTLVSVEEKQTILDIGQNILIIPLVVSGIISVSRIDSDGNEIHLYYLHSSQSCALTFICCMQPNKSQIKAVTETYTEYLALPIELMEDWMSKYPSWKNYVMQTIQNSFLDLLHTIDELAFHKLDERLIHYLKHKSNAIGTSLINLSHEQIAIELATSREVISRLLKKLEKDNKILLYRNQIKLLSQF